jgi:CRP-like cAMP-binding protein
MNLMKNLKQVTYEAHSQIYFDNSISECIYFVIQGKVKLVAENDYAFAHFNNGEVFGETDVLCDINRNGKAVAIEHTILYYTMRDEFINSIVSYPEDHNRLRKSAIQKNR